MSTSSSRPTSVKTALIPVAGLGTRFLPATKAVPKELLPIVDKPTLQFIVEEAVASGIEHIVFVNGRNKSAIEDHFDVSYELDHTLRSRDKEQLAENMRDIDRMCRFSSVRQKEPLGLGHAVLCGREIIGDEPFAVLLGDDLMRTTPDKTPGIGQLMGAFEATGTAQVALIQVPKSEISKYGAAVGRADEKDARRFFIDSLVEKPEPGTVDTDRAVIGRYVLPPTIWDLLAKTQKGRGGEIQLTDALSALLKLEGLMGYVIDGLRLDAGDKIGYLEAQMREALSREDLRGPVREMLMRVLGLPKRKEPA